MITRYILQRRVLPVQVDAIRMKIITKFPHTQRKFLPAAVRGKDMRTGRAAAPATQGQDHLEFWMLLLQGNKMGDHSAVVGIVHPKSVAFQMTKAVDDMVQLLRGK